MTLDYHVKKKLISDDFKNYQSALVMHDLINNSRKNVLCDAQFIHALESLLMIYLIYFQSQVKRKHFIHNSNRNNKSNINSS